LPIENLPGASFTLGNGTFWSIPYIAYIAFGIAIILTFVSKNTRFGLYSYAIGTNREAVRRAGVNLKWHSVLLYGLCGALAGLAGMLNAVHFSSASSSSGSSDLLVAIAAVVIGGTPITGGEGKVWGTVIGALIYTILQNGFVLMNVASFWQLIVIGFLIMVVVSLDNYQRRLHALTRISKELESISPDAGPPLPNPNSSGEALA
jgi:ribose transport system permease protein